MIKAQADDQFKTKVLTAASLESYQANIYSISKVPCHNLTP